ncbi:MAG: beta-galactosidase [Planctomycetota bacterium]
MRIGVDYYPEHWPTNRWETDAKLMQKAGFNVVRMAEFAWQNMEPEEGVYVFDWLDRAIDILGKHGIATVLGTPTAAMPAWCARKYPESLAMNPKGDRVTWGMRKNNCFSSGAFRLLSERITGAMADHYAENPYVIGWQTDNEFGGHPMCYCPVCRNEFQDWLRCRYGTLDVLNEAWGTHFWGQRYETWGEITLPDDFSAHNPSACLDWKRFFSDQNVRFQRDQVQILRAVCPEQFITHNFMGLFSEINYWDLAEDLDFVSWDNYPVSGEPNMGYNYRSAMAADVMRSLKKKNFWIMEQTCGAHGWGTFGRLIRPGELRKIAYQQLARGADAQVWFRWRACTAGREQYWHGVLGHDGIPRRRYDEAAKTTSEYHSLEKKLDGKTVKADVAMIYDYESVWALSIQPCYSENKYHEVLGRYYQALFRAGIAVDMVKPGADLSGYKVVLAPDLYILRDAHAQQIDAFIKRGGVFLADCRFAVKNESNLCYDRPLPGLLADALGVRIDEYESLRDGMKYKVKGNGALDGDYTGIYFADWVIPQTAETLAVFDEPHLADYAAATRNKYKKGTAYYVGMLTENTAFYDRLIADMLSKAKIVPLVAAPEGVEVSAREDDKKRLVFLLNHTEETKTVDIPAGGRDALQGKSAGRSVALDKYDAAVIEYPV